MNCGVLLLLVATLYTIGCAQEEITVGDAKTAITAAWNLYNGADRHVQQVPQLHLKVAQLILK